MRRRLARIGIVVVLLVGAAGAAWWVGGGRIAEAALARMLPLSVGEGVVLERVVADPVATPPPAVVVTAQPGRAKALVAAMLERALPPRSVRDGLTVDGSIRHPLLLPEMPLGLRLRADASLPSAPLVEARLPTRQLDALVARLCAAGYAAGDLPMAMTPTIDPGASLDDAGDAIERDGLVERRFRWAATGTIAIPAGVFRVRAAAGQLIVACETERNGYAPKLSIALERLDYEAPASWPKSLLPPDPKPLVERLVNARLAELPRVLLPLWTPFDARVRVLVDGPPAPVPAPTSAAIY